MHVIAARFPRDLLRRRAAYTRSDRPDKVVRAPAYSPGGALYAWLLIASGVRSAPTEFAPLTDRPASADEHFDERGSSSNWPFV